MSAFIFTLTQDDMEVARVESDDGDAAMREIMHYARIYAQDGPCTVKALVGDFPGFEKITL